MDSVNPWMICYNLYLINFKNISIIYYENSDIEICVNFANYSDL